MELIQHLEEIQKSFLTLKALLLSFELLSYLSLPHFRSGRGGPQSRSPLRRRTSPVFLGYVVEERVFPRKDCISSEGP